MDTWCCVSIWLVLARAVHFGACLLLLNVWLFDRIIIAPAARVWPSIEEFWRSIGAMLLWLALPTALVSGIWWFILVAGGMSGLPFSQAAHPATLAIVWRQTVFGHVSEWRLFFWLGILAAAGLHSLVRFPAVSVWIGLALSALLCGSIAGTGHAQTGVAVPTHLLADVVHVLTAAAWPTGLLPLMMLLWKVRQVDAPEKKAGVIVLVGRFSAMSVIAVVLLIGTGYINAFLLLGSWANLFATAYGHVLMLKIGLLAVIICIAAVNLLHLKPRLERGETVTRRLRINVAIELSLAIIILLVVGLLGLLPPAQ